MGLTGYLIGLFVYMVIYIAVYAWTTECETLSGSDEDLFFMFGVGSAIWPVTILIVVLAIIVYALIFIVINATLYVKAKIVGMKKARGARTKARVELISTTEKIINAKCNREVF